ncbi:TRAP transporter permease [Hyphomicrobium sp. CS1BSMeth3]|uniref:TRAP transporter permease n=1 Tax=Hyphomicrobium sp. CS1BSMeth3 TaxID=1892844 RepID=UPI00092FE234|nr:TRAP transporter permease [Hyphomicrobium sp. CS1BSMeth3]
MTYARATQMLVTVLGTTFTVYHLYVAFVGVPEPLIFRGTHLLWMLVLAFLVYAGFSGRRDEPPGFVDWLFVAASLASVGYIFYEYEYFITRFATVDDLRPADWILGTTLIVCILEATRRVLGAALSITAIVFMAYCLTFTNVSAQMMLDQLYMTTDGILGIPISVSATYVVLFIIFGAFVEKTGTGKLFMDFGLALAGAKPGGPAKVAVITSGMFGTISGSAVSNVMTTGVFTIPMMKRIGYRPAFAGAVEAVASTGGQIMPPIMGAAAFVMAEYLAVSYLTVAVMALLPAFLYYLAVYAAVHLEARRTGMRGLPKPDLPQMRAVLQERGHQFIPLLVITAVLFAGYSAPYAALCGIFSVLPTALLRKSTRHYVRIGVIIDALTSAAKDTLTIALACAAAGIVIGVVLLSGLAIEFTAFIVRISQDTLTVALVLTAIAGIVLGMGLPTTPAYIIQVALLVPALVKLGVQIEAAHLFVFYYSCLSTITPPVALAVFAAKGIAGGNLWDTGWAAVKLGATGYIVPFMCVYSTALMLMGPWQDVLLAAVTASIGVVCLAAGLHAYFIKPAKWWERLMLLGAAMVLITPGLITDLIGASLIALTILSQVMIPRPEAAAFVMPPEPGAPATAKATTSPSAGSAF